MTKTAPHGDNSAVRGVDHLDTPHNFQQFDLPTRMEELHQREMIRIHGLWKVTKDELRAKTQELEALEKRRMTDLIDKDREWEDTMQSVSHKSRAAQDRLTHMEGQLRRANEERIHESEKVAELTGKLNDAQFALKQAQDTNGRQMIQVHELAGKIKILSSDKQEVIEKSFREIQRQMEALRAKEDEVDVLERKLGQLEAKSRQDKQELSKSKTYIETLEVRLDQQSNVIKTLQGDLESANEQLKYTKVYSKSEQQLHLDIEQMKADNARLLRLLATTTEFADFMDFSEDCNGVRYVSSAESDTYPSGGETVPMVFTTLVEGDRPVVVRKEKEYWVPTDALREATEFKHRHLPALPVELFSELLLRLNHIWYQRECRRLKRQKKAQQEVVDKLKRQLAQRMPYEEVVHLNEIERLKSLVSRLQASLKQKHRRPENADIRLLEGNLETVQRLTNKVSDLTTENELLRARQATKGSLTDNDAAFLEGSCWMASSMSILGERTAERLTDLITGYLQLLAELDPNDDEFIEIQSKKQERFIRDVQGCVQSLRNRMKAVLEETMIQKDRPNSEALSEKKARMMQSANASQRTQ